MSYPLIPLKKITTINPRFNKIDITEDSDISFIPMSSVSENGFLLEEETLKYSEVKKGLTYFDKNDVLIAKITPCFENGKSLRPQKIRNDIGFGSTEFHVLRANTEKLNSLYLFYLLWSDNFRALGEHAMSGAAGQKRISTNFLKDFKIPLPPLKEQRRIAAILDQADELRQKRQESINKLDELLQATFIGMFGDPVTNPKGWMIHKASQVLKIQSGFAFSSKDFTSTGIPVIKIGNANKVGFNTEKLDFIQPQNPTKLKQYELKKGDLLLSLTGTVGKDDYGNITEVDDTYEMYYLNQRVAKLNINKTIVLKYFIRSLFSQNSIKHSLTKNNRGVRQANISNADIYNLKIPIPPMSIQQIWTKISQSIEAQKQKLQEQLEQQNNLFNSLQQQAFSGKL